MPIQIQRKTELILNYLSSFRCDDSQQTYINVLREVCSKNISGVIESNVVAPKSKAHQIQREISKDGRILIGQEDCIEILLCMKQIINNYLWRFENLWNHLKVFYVEHNNAFRAEGKHPYHVSSQRKVTCCAKAQSRNCASIYIHELKIIYKP
jgi:hypothetical protein